MFSKVLFSLLTLTLLTACENPHNTQVSVAISGETINHAISVCKINGGLRQVHTDSKGVVIKNYQTRAECKNGASFKLAISLR